MNEALGAIAPRLLSQLRLGTLLPSMWFVTLTVLFQNASEGEAKPDGWLDNLNSWFEIEVSDLVLPAVATIFLAFAFDLSFPILERLLSRPSSMLLPIRDPIRDYAEAVVGKGRYQSKGKYRNRHGRRQRTLARRREIPNVSSSKTPITSGVKTTRVNGDPKREGREFYRWSRWGTAVIAMGQGPNGFDHSKYGDLIVAAVRSERPHDTAVAWSFNRAVALLGVSVATLLAFAIGSIPLASRFGIVQVMFLGVISTGVARGSYLAAVRSIGAAAKALDDLYFQYRWSVLESIEPPSGSDAWKRPTTRKEELERWSKAYSAVYSETADEDSSSASINS